MSTRIKYFYGQSARQADYASFILAADLDFSGEWDPTYDPTTGGPPENVYDWASAGFYGYSGVKVNSDSYFHVLAEHVMIEDHTLVVIDSLDITPEAVPWAFPETGPIGMTGEYWGIGSKVNATGGHSIFSYKRVGNSGSGNPDRIAFPTGSFAPQKRMDTFRNLMNGVTRQAVSKAVTTDLTFATLSKASAQLYHGKYN